MSENHGPYYRTGGPGEPGCPVGTLTVKATNLQGAEIQGQLLDAGNDVTELAVLRTVAQRLGVKWGRDDLGWWALIPFDSSK